MDVTVTAVKSDFDPYGGEYTYVSFGYRTPVPVPPQPSALGPQPKQIMYKHALHVIVPRDKWVGQYNMWEQYHLIVKDDGLLELKKAEPKL
jgi:hypothetical protein